jgi:hypothetical protein
VGFRVGLLAPPDVEVVIPVARGGPRAALSAELIQ